MPDPAWIARRLRLVPQHRRAGEIAENVHRRPRPLRLPAGTLWGPVIIATELIGGPMLALGLFTRLVSIPIAILLIMSIVEHVKDGWFWNTLGVEYPLIWSAAALYFLVYGGGEISLDALIGWEF